MISNREKALLHIYAGVAGVERATYRNILRSEAGVCSAADSQMSHAGFRRAMAVLDDHLWAAVDALEMEPRHLPRSVSPRGFWRSQVPVDRSMVGPSKLALISKLYGLLTPVVPVDGDGDSYLSAAIDRSVGRPISDLRTLTDREAGAVIECLRSMLRRHGGSEA